MAGGAADPGSGMGALFPDAHRAGGFLPVALEAILCLEDAGGEKEDAEDEEVQGHFHYSSLNGIDFWLRFFLKVKIRGSRPPTPPYSFVKRLKSRQKNA
jgi:hypothetical protein